MKVVLAGAFGNLGAEILKCLVRDGHDIVAADLKEAAVEGCAGRYTFVPIDATKPETLKGLCDGAEVVITTMGLTGASTKFTSYDIDHKGRKIMRAADCKQLAEKSQRDFSTSLKTPGMADHSRYFHRLSSGSTTRSAFCAMEKASKYCCSMGIHSSKNLRWRKAGRREIRCRRTSGLTVRKIFRS